MANEVLQKARSRVAVQTSSALTANEYPGDGSYTLTTNCVSIDNASGENGDGCDYLVLELDLTNASYPTTAATAAIYWRGTNDGGTTWTKWKYSHSVGDSLIASTADRYDAGMFSMTYTEVELAVSAIGYGFTSALYATPKLMEIQ